MGLRPFLETRGWVKDLMLVFKWQGKGSRGKEDLEGGHPDAHPVLVLKDLWESVGNSFSERSQVEGPDRWSPYGQVDLGWCWSARVSLPGHV